MAQICPRPCPSTCKMIRRVSAFAALRILFWGICGPRAREALLEAAIVKIMLCLPFASHWWRAALCFVAVGLRRSRHTEFLAPLASSLWLGCVPAGFYEDAGRAQRSQWSSGCCVPSAAFSARGGWCCQGVRCWCFSAWQIYRQAGWAPCAEVVFWPRALLDVCMLVLAVF